VSKLEGSEGPTAEGLERGFKCQVCGKVFKNSRALASHIHYRHPGHGEGRGEALDLKQEFTALLTDVGVKPGRSKVIADIFFDMGGDDLSKLDELLRLAAVGNPQRALVLKRWGQRIGKSVPESLLKEGSAAGSEDYILEAYDRLTQAELKQLLLEDLRARIEERRRRLKPEEEEAEPRWKPPKYEPICPCTTPEVYGRVVPMGDRLALYCTAKDRPCVFYGVVELTTCSNCRHSFRIDHVPLGAEFTCPSCGTTYVKDHFSPTVQLCRMWMPVGWH
jgi:uncharacterized C2H2 Zn-finger protein/predicted RNA-binding Zn-ribbon protein involved in translation (DUF1610 family)